MDWSDEPYVRLYTRDTTNWRRFGWEGQAVLSLLLRKVDRAGVLDLGDLAPWEAVALATGMPEEVVQTGVARLLKLGTLTVRGEQLVIPNHLAAQTSTKSDKLRQKETRERRALGLDPSVTNRDGAVTPRDVASRKSVPGHAESHAVTNSHSLLCSAVLSNAEQRSDSDVRARVVSSPFAERDAQDFAASVPTRFRKLYLERFQVDVAIGGQNVGAFPERLRTTAEAQELEPLVLLERLFAAWCDQGRPGVDKQIPPYSAFIARFDALAAPALAKVAETPQHELAALRKQHKALCERGEFGDPLTEVVRQIQQLEKDLETPRGGEPRRAFGR
jgi:hypothetical protein